MRASRWVDLPDEGVRRVVLAGPVRRRWSSDGVLASEVAVSGHREPTGIRIDGDEEVEVDVLELDPAAAAAAEGDRREPLLVLGSFTALEGPETLARFLVGGSVLDTTSFGGRRCPSEQTALSLWRACRLRGGAFWDGAADHVARWVLDRIEAAPTAGPVHDLWERRETHVRFLVDAALLLLAEQQRVEPAADSDRWHRAADRALDMVDGFAVPYGGGRWYLHDSLERDRGENDLVLNTHAQAMSARLAAGRDLGDSAAALDAALRARPAPWVDAGLALGLAVIDTAEGRLAPVTPRLRRVTSAVARRAESRAARARHASPHLRTVGGRIARDARAAAPPAYYLTTNLYDLGVLVANHDGALGPAAGRIERAFTSGIRYAERTGFARRQRREGHGLASLWPIIHHQAGDTATARRLVDRWPTGLPVPGWPGRLDAPWRALRAGTA